MITLNNILGLRGLSTDSKPTEGIRTNCRFWELDTGKYYYFDGSAWQDAPGGGGGGGDIDELERRMTAAEGDISDLQAEVVKEVTVSGTDPVITAEGNTRYICGEVTTLSFTPPATGICEVLFTSGSTATVLTVPNTVRWANGFDPTALETDMTYELNILGGIGIAISVEVSA